MKTDKGFFAQTGAFLKRNIYYVLLFICIAAIATMIVVAVVLNKGGKKLPDEGNNDQQQNPPDDTDNTPVVKPMVFSLPVKDGTIAVDFSFTQFVWLDTQQRFQIHEGIDFAAAAGANVYAVFDGVVESIDTNVLDGTVITILHQDGFETIYKSLDSNVKVRVGDTVKTDDVIGYVSDTMMYEVAEGPHLHFEVKKDGQIINPYTYLPSIEK